MRCSFRIRQSLQCGACIGMLKVLRERATPDNDMAVVYRHFPLDSRGLSYSAALLAELAADKQAFWRFVEAVHTAPRPLSSSTLLACFERSTGESVRLDGKSFPLVPDSCARRVARDLQLALRLKVKGTPAAVILREGAPPELFDKPLSYLDELIAKTKNRRN
jgi:protein-disulfide isomerase